MALDLMYSEVLDDVDTEFDVDLPEEGGDDGEDEFGYGSDEESEKKLAGADEESEDGSSGDDNTY